MEPVHKSFLLDPFLSQMNPVHNLTPYFCKIYSDIILPFMPLSPEWSLVSPGFLEFLLKNTDSSAGITTCVLYIVFFINNTQETKLNGLWEQHNFLIWCSLYVFAQFMCFLCQEEQQAC
jgi:hypothetical protein